MRLDEAIHGDDEELITEATKKAEEIIRESLQVFPDDEHLLNEEARLATLLTDSERALKALKKAFEINSNNGFLGGCLSSVYVSLGDIPAGKKVLEQLISANPADKIAHGKNGKYTR